MSDSLHINLTPSTSLTHVRNLRRQLSLSNPTIDKEQDLRPIADDRNLRSLSSYQMGTMSRKETIAAATKVVHNLARGAVPTFDPPECRLASRNSTVNGLESPKFNLPGEDDVTKEQLEKELSALALRIQYLEAKANTVNHQNLPNTPSEFGLTSSPFDANGSAGTLRNAGSVPVRQGSASSRSARVSNLLAVRETGNDGRRSFSEEELGQLRDHVQKQADEIRSQKETIASVSVQLDEQQKQTERAFVKVEHEDVGALERELKKHQQANEAFQKALKEIGSIVTAVANGDLSKKVQIHSVEMDPEITTFKRTINTMMDQLQVFGSEVSRVAKEVGTEGKLGGQAQITGVNGIWKELTENGRCSRKLDGAQLTLGSQRHGEQPD